MRKYLIVVISILSIGILKAQEWETDFEKAKEIAKQKNQNIVLVFSGSDWCAPCIKLEKEIWSSDEFKKFAKENVVLVKADFPRRKENKLPKEQLEKNNKLAEQYNQQGFFPFVVVLNGEGKILGSTGYKKVSPEEYVAILDSY
jgi:thioredoxin-related protein